MILLKKAYRGSYIEIRPVTTHPGDGALTGRALIWIDGIPMDEEFICPRATLLPALLKVATDRIDRDLPHQA